MNRPKTIICDIDGTLIKHFPPHITTKSEFEPELLNGVLIKFQEWEKLGYHILLLTARKESMRQITITQLCNLGIFFDQLIMGVTSGERHLINDKKEGGENTAFAHNIERDLGISKIYI